MLVGNLRNRYRRFRRIESVRKVIEERKKEELLAARAELNKELDKKGKLEKKLESLISEKASFPIGSKLSASLLSRVHRSIGYMVGSIKKQEQIVNRALERVREVQSEYLEYKKDRQRISFLRERVFEKLREELIKLEEREIEEVFRNISHVIKGLHKFNG